MPVAEPGDRFPFFEGFSSRAEYHAALRRLEEFLAHVAAAEVADLRERDERLAEDFPSSRALHAAIRRLAIELRAATSGAASPARWLPRPTVGVRN